MGYVPLTEEQAEHLESLLSAIPEYCELTDAEKQDLKDVLGGKAEPGTFLSEKAEAVATQFMNAY